MNDARTVTWMVVGGALALAPVALQLGLHFSRPDLLGPFLASSWALPYRLVVGGLVAASLVANLLSARMKRGGGVVLALSVALLSLPAALLMLFAPIVWTFINTEAPSP